MSTIVSTLRDNLVSNLRAVYPDGVQVGKYAVTNPSPPTLQILSGGVPDFLLAQRRGFQQYQFIVQGVTAITDAGQSLIDEWADPHTGIRDALEADNGTTGATQIIVRSLAPTRIAIIGGIDYLLAEWTVDVYPE